MDNIHIYGQELETHPIYTNDAILPTRALEACVNAIKQWDDNLLPGGIVFGRQRHGKSFTIEYMMANIILILGRPVPVALLIAWKQNERVSETRFYTELLDALDYEFSEAMSFTKLRRRTIGFMEQKARDLGAREFLLFIDEAQELSESAYRYLIKCHNELARRNIRLIVILVGQPNLESIRSNMIDEKKREIVGRFMTGVHELTGIKDLSDLTRMYQSIDIESEYPVGSGSSYTRYFIGKAFDNNFRLANNSERVWHFIEKSLRDIGLSLPRQISMQAIMSLTRYLLIELSALDDADLELTDKMIEDAIDYAALLQLQTDALTEDN